MRKPKDLVDDAETPADLIVAAVRGRRLRTASTRLRARTPRRSLVHALPDGIPVRRSREQLRAVARPARTARRMTEPARQRSCPRVDRTADLSAPRAMPAGDRRRGWTAGSPLAATPALRDIWRIEQ